MTENIEFFFTNLEPKDFLDLFILFLIFYQIFKFAERSGVFQVLVGFGAVACAFLVSEYLELMTVHTVLEAVFSNLFLVLALIFQTEIRRGLTQLGSQNFFRDLETVEKANTSEEIVKSVIQMSKKGVGALLVFENKIDISSYTDTGIAISCDVKNEVIQSLFHPTSSVHDGAVVIKDGKINRLAAFLPLSTNPALDKNLGTRHRAALGISEITDAKVVVVSEESKKIALVEDGKLNYVSSKENIHTEVRAFLMSKGRQSL